VIYLDAAALIKMIREETETAELITWLNAHPDDQLVASALVEVEVSRALRRSEPDALPAVATTLARLVRIEVDAAVRATAAAYTDLHLRSLDAVHLATAEHLAAAGKPITAFVTYDRRLLAAAHDAKLPVTTPGMSTTAD
jgi:predicted nucleic acid-binding protein